MISLLSGSIVYWLVTVSFVISLFLLWLLMLASWGFNPRFIPKLQFRFLRLIFRPFWYLRVIAAQFFPRFKTISACIGCHKLASHPKFNGNDTNSFGMKVVAQYISLPTRPYRSFYFFAGLVFPLLPLDFTGNKSESWNRIYACFTHILNRDKINLRSEQIARKYAEEYAHQLSLHQERQLIISDEKLRYIICAIMWELVFSSEPSESDLKIITTLTESISRSFTYNIDPDWSNRIDLCIRFLEQIRYHPKIGALEKDFKLTAQEMCTVVGMELFITPALEIAEVMTNLMTGLASDHTGLIQQISCDSNLMRYAIITAAHRYPVLQVFCREISYVQGDTDFTPCFSWFQDTHSLHIQAQIISQSIKNESISEVISRYISDQNDSESSMSEVNTCMAFGKGPRICKGKELAIKIITAFLSTLYNELDAWPNVTISAGRKSSTPFRSIDDRWFYFNRRCWIADVQYFFDKIFHRTTLQRFQCQL